MTLSLDCVCMRPLEVPVMLRLSFHSYSYILLWRDIVWMINESHFLKLYALFDNISFNVTIPVDFQNCFNAPHHSDPSTLHPASIYTSISPAKLLPNRYFINLYIVIYHSREIISLPAFNLW